MRTKALLILFAMTALIVTLSFCSGQEKNIQAKELDFDGLKGIVNGNLPYVLIDVRTPEEYASGHIPKAINIPNTEIAQKINVSKKDALIIVYCRSGNRSGQAEMALREAGYTNVVNFGPVSKWKDTLVTGDKPE